MDLGAIHLGVMEILGALVLLAVLIWMVVRTRSGGKKDSPPETERATRELYAKEERKHDDGTENL